MARSHSFSRTQSATHRRGSSLPLALDDEHRHWLEANKARLLAGGGVLAAVAAVVLLVVLFHRSQIAAGREDLRVGIAALQAGKLEEALSALERAKARFTTGDEARLTRFYLSEAYQRSGRGEEARQTLVTSPAAAEDAAYLAQSLFLAQGQAAERQQDLQAARKAYESASLLDGPFTAEALLSVARVCEATGDKTAALAAREKVLGSYPTTPFAEVIRQQLGK